MPMNFLFFLHSVLIFSCVNVFTTADDSTASALTKNGEAPFETEKVFAGNMMKISDEKKADSDGGCLSQSDQDVIYGKAFHNSITKNMISSDRLSFPSSFSLSSANNHVELNDHSTYSSLSSTASKGEINALPKPSNEFFCVLFKCGKKGMGNIEMVDRCLHYELHVRNVTLSNECSLCYAKSAQCGAKHCAGQCLTNQCTKQCLECGKEKCEKELHECTKLDKLPEPCKPDSSTKTDFPADSDLIYGEF